MVACLEAFSHGATAGLTATPEFVADRVVRPMHVPRDIRAADATDGDCRRTTSRRQATTWDGPGAQGPGSWAVFHDGGERTSWKRGRSVDIDHDLLDDLEMLGALGPKRRRGRRATA